MFIQTETTPNPNSLKFFPGCAVMEDGTRDYRDARDAAKSPLASALFSLEGVGGVFFGPDFITVSKTGDTSATWPQLQPAIFGAIMDHFMSGAPLLDDGAAAIPDDEFFDSADAELVATVKNLLETRVRPAVAQDGGDIIFRGFRDGTVYLHMRGACAGCPSSTLTLKHGIENLLRHFVPAVQNVEAV